MNEAQEVVTWDGIVHNVMPQFERIARNHNLVTWQEESQFAIQAIQGNKGLSECAPHTVQNAVVNVAAVGLTLNPADGYAYLVPEYNKATRSKECQLRISFKGLVKAATDTGAIQWVKAEVVKENDTFTYNGPAKMPDHSMSPFTDRGPSVGVYCIAKVSENEFLCDVMAWEEVLKIKSCAKTQNVWDNWPDEMAKKAIIKRAAKQWPKTEKSSVLHKAVEVINDAEGTEFDPFAALEATADDLLQLVESGDTMEVGKVWCECTEQEQKTLWTAKTKGGWFSADEKTVIRDGIAEYKKAVEGEE